MCNELNHNKWNLFKYDILRTLYCKQCFYVQVSHILCIENSIGTDLYTKVDNIVFYLFNVILDTEYQIFFGFEYLLQM